MVGQDRKVKGASLAGLGTEVSQGILDLQDTEVNREREVLMVAQVKKDTQECLVIKVCVVYQDHPDHQVS